MSSWTEDRVRIIKLEDFRSNQADYIDSINNFFGITEEPEVKKWFAKVGFWNDFRISRKNWVRVPLITMRMKKNPF